MKTNNFFSIIYPCSIVSFQIYIIHPGTVKIPVQFNDVDIVKFFPHLTMEDPPHLHQDITHLIFFDSARNLLDTNILNMNILDIGRLHWIHFWNQLEKLKSEFSLNLYITQF